MNDACKSDMIAKIKMMERNTPDGIIMDADTILADILSNFDREQSGLADYIFEIWENAEGYYARQIVEEMFYAFTDVEFSNYLHECVNRISRSK